MIHGKKTVDFITPDNNLLLTEGVITIIYFICCTLLPPGPRQPQFLVYVCNLFTSNARRKSWDVMSFPTIGITSE